MKGALITGGSRGIGRAAAELFLQSGWRVACTYNETVPQAGHSSGPGDALAIRCDVTKLSQCEGFVERALGEMGDFDTLVCCAGVSYTNLFQLTPESEYDRLFDVNMRGCFNMCRAAAPHFIRRGGGSIVLLGSMWGTSGASCEAVYAASKAAVAGFAKSLARELAPSAVRVNCLAPGLTLTGMNKSIAQRDMEALLGEIPLGRAASAREMAQYILFLAGDESAYMTGQLISPNGGLVI